MPSIFKNHKCTAIKERLVKSTYIDGVEVIVSPDVIYKVSLTSELYLGAVKLHISKGNIFDTGKSKLVSSILYKYMNELAENYHAKVLPELCFSIDVFGERVVLNSNIDTSSAFIIEKLCSEVKRVWYTIA